MRRHCAALAVAAASALVPCATAQPAVPTPDGRYTVSRALVEDYVACGAEARALAALSAESDVAIASLSAEMGVRQAEAEALRDALDAADVALRLCAGRRNVAAADAAGAHAALDAALARATRAERSRRRWRTLALASPLAVGVAGVVAGALLFP